MHELSLCRSIIDQLEELAQQHNAASVSRVEVQVGLLSGVEPQLLEQAFKFAQVGTIAEQAVLVTDVVSPSVSCLSCGAETPASNSDLTCRTCGGLHTKLIRGGELILAHVQMVPAKTSAIAGQGS